MGVLLYGIKEGLSLMTISIDSTQQIPISDYAQDIVLGRQRNHQNVGRNPWPNIHSENQIICTNKYDVN